ncbi:MAG: hypothetical protein EXS68_01035 [Candidatus Ryanbacteria bacterium]|nr:hypothetical protein [Candidatus Ryanbacteria bacterium]
MEGETKFSTPQEEIRYLEGRIAEKKREMGDATPHAAAREVLREHATLAPAPTTPMPQTVPAEPAQDELSRSVALLVDEAMSGGVLDAIARARETHNPYLIDAFHDALVERFTTGNP